jgi:hypothetical protein
MKPMKMKTGGRRFGLRDPVIDPFTSNVIANPWSRWMSARSAALSDARLRLYGRQFFALNLQFTGATIVETA